MLWLSENLPLCGERLLLKNQAAAAGETFFLGNVFLEGECLITQRTFLARVRRSARAPAGEFHALDFLRNGIPFNRKVEKLAFPGTIYTLGGDGFYKCFCIPLLVLSGEGWIPDVLCSKKSIPTDVHVVYTGSSTVH